MSVQTLGNTAMHTVFLLFLFFFNLYAKKDFFGPDLFYLLNIHTKILLFRNFFGSAVTCENNAVNQKPSWLKKKAAMIK